MATVLIFYVSWSLVLVYGLIAVIRPDLVRRGQRRLNSVMRLESLARRWHPGWKIMDTPAYLWYLRITGAVSFVLALLILIFITALRNQEGVGIR